MLCRFQDGAATANNPAAIAVQEALLLWPGLPIDCLVSLGSGAVPAAPREKSMSSYLDTGSVLIESACETERTDAVLRTLFSLIPDTRYYRCLGGCGLGGTEGLAVGPSMIYQQYAGVWRPGGKRLTGDVPGLGACWGQLLALKARCKCVAARGLAQTPWHPAAAQSAWCQPCMLLCTTANSLVQQQHMSPESSHKQQSDIPGLPCTASSCSGRHPRSLHAELLAAWPHPR